jgi:hypothetical protein
MKIKLKALFGLKWKPHIVTALGHREPDNISQSKLYSQK